MTNRSQYSPELKTKIVLVVISAGGRIADRAYRYKIQPNMISKWKRAAEDNMNVGLVRKRVSALDIDLMRVLVNSV